MKDHHDLTESNAEPFDRLDGIIRAALEEIGAALPTSAEGVSLLEKHLRENQVSLPEHLQDANLILERIKAKYTSEPSHTVICFKSPYQDAVQEDLARAARKGGAISGDVEEKMRRDREKAERAKIVTG